MILLIISNPQESNWNGVDIMSGKFESAKASLEIEGFTISKEIEDLARSEADGTISFQEFISKVDALRISK